MTPLDAIAWLTVAFMVTGLLLVWVVLYKVLAGAYD